MKPAATASTVKDNSAITRPCFFLPGWEYPLAFLQYVPLYEKNVVTVVSRIVGKMSIMYPDYLNVDCGFVKKIIKEERGDFPLALMFNATPGSP
jgi:hypothetical protein